LISSSRTPLRYALLASGIRFVPSLLLSDVNPLRWASHRGDGGTVSSAVLLNYAGNCVVANSASIRSPDGGHTLRSVAITLQKFCFEIVLPFLKVPQLCVLSQARRFSVALLFCFFVIVQFSRCR